MRGLRGRGLSVRRAHLGGLLLLLWGAPAAAHRPGLSYAEITDERLTLTFSRDELAARFPFGEVAEARDLLAEATLDKVQIGQGDAACALGAPTLSEVAGGEPAPGATAATRDGVSLSAPLTCPGDGPRSYDAGFLSGMETGHRHFVTVNGEPIAVLDAGHASAPLPAPAPRGPGALGLPALAGGGLLVIGALLALGARKKRPQTPA